MSGEMSLQNRTETHHMAQKNFGYLADFAELMPEAALARFISVFQRLKQIVRTIM